MKKNQEKGPFAIFFKQKRKETSLTQAELARKAGVGIRFVRDVEQGKSSVRLDRLNAVLSLFGFWAGPVRSPKGAEYGENG